MRITVNIEDSLGANIKRAAENQGVSVSALVSRAVEHYLVQTKRRKLGARLLELAGSVPVAAGALEELEGARSDDRT